MDHLETAKDLLKIPETDKNTMQSLLVLTVGSIANSLIALVERIDRLTGHDADGNPMIRTKEGR